MTTEVRINEIFGPTMQGEGPMMGRHCGFIRFAECNLACSWCDTPYTWDWNKHDRSIESRIMRIEDVASEALKMATSVIVLTGGEPMIYQSAFKHLKDYMPNVMFTVETNGTIQPSLDALLSIGLFIVSPKLPNSGNAIKKSIKSNALESFAELTHDGQAAFKWVVANEQDIEIVSTFCSEFNVRRSATWIMPLGRTRVQHVGNLIDLADSIISAGFNVSSRLHVIAWDELRGV